MSPVHVIGVALVFHRLMSAVWTVLMLFVFVVRHVGGGRTLIDVTLVLMVHMTLVHVVSVVLVLNVGVAAFRAVLVGVCFVYWMGRSHAAPLRWSSHRRTMNGVMEAQLLPRKVWRARANQQGGRIRLCTRWHTRETYLLARVGVWRQLSG